MKDHQNGQLRCSLKQRTTKKTTLKHPQHWMTTRCKWSLDMLTEAANGKEEHTATLRSLTCYSLCINYYESYILIRDQSTILLVHTAWWTHTQHTDTCSRATLCAVHFPDPLSPLPHVSTHTSTHCTHCITRYSLLAGHCQSHSHIDTD